MPFNLSSTLSQTSRSMPNQSAIQSLGGAFPKPSTPQQAIGIFVLCVVLLVAIFGVVIWLKRRDG